MSEIAPKAIRGAIVAGYQWAITLVSFAQTRRLVATVLTAVSS
jgi:hypothetical protein